MKITYPLPPNLPEQLPLLTNCQLEDEAILENHLYQQIDLSNQEVRNLVFRDAVFDHLSLANGQFASFDCSNVRFEGCDLTESNWLNTSLKGLDFSQNTFERLTFSPNYLSGLKVTPEQAIYLASALGLVIT
ncbi:TPA: pentapeptide repeat-containing protein [Enterococcus faecalis]|uniref:pentapeptide repeat-containing protein n=1 Tax=Enterococcus faecalis TaxID=1351 RepID=UPI0009F9CD3D|nr:pentapeptide repeat-containing protein [Enterococcus faecalis]EGO8269358.1 hypothetical protein [Enterococcus faecalis]MCM6934726.1 pentapeptide repeat-containing protein [Enterococcus faecalis]MDF4248365.1 pentapeptide repeat-containing protein [Enterococcus faecalis]ORE52322.1 hypothetical protein B6A11_10485 [Enterococcus faecalis]UYY33893.1 pentapeptide repeat-containing protein [Enterococcus faecalis]